MAPLTPATANTVYEPVPGWARIPHGIWLKEATAVAVDSNDHVYVFNRGNMPVLVFDSKGHVVDMWGNDNPYGGVVEMTDPYGNKYQAWGGPRFKRPHAITIDHEDNVWLVD
ncbi:MAG: peptidylglycine alpha-amidating monooxygenase, partial [Chloroflexi bacterium]|nr:peptidylglycine alpha-amidating monooxygenase [Chloroflexota bacterium]